MDVSPEVILQIFAFILLTVVGWGVRMIWNKVSEFDGKMDTLRKELHAENDDSRRELHAEMKHYVHEATCKAHREGIEKQIDAIKAVHGVVMTSQGLAVVDINNPQQMRTLHDAMTPEQCRAHAAQCQFRAEMD